jgi:hypothetical protein
MAFTGIKREYCAKEGGIDHVLIFLTTTANLAITKDVDTKVTSIVSTGTATAYKLEPHRGFGYANENGNGNHELKSRFYTQEIQIKGVTLDNTIKQAIESIDRSLWLAIVHYNNGDSRLFGVDSGLVGSSSADESKEALGDAWEYSIMLQSPEESEKAPFVKDATKSLPYGVLATELTIVAFA